MNFRLIISSIFMLIFLGNIEAVSEGVLGAMQFCADSIVPSLLVFFIMSDIVVKSFLSDKNKISPKWIAFLLGSVCGFPVGAAVCETFSKESGINTGKLLPYCNNTSPAFVLGAIGVCMLNDIRIGILLYFSEILAAFLLILPIKCDSFARNNVFQNGSLIEDFQESVEKAVKTTLKMCGIICFFSALLSLIKENMGEKVFKFFAILLEIGSGMNVCSGIFEKNQIMAIALLGFLCGWSGICVHMQIISALRSIKVKVSYMIWTKFLHGILSSLLSVLGYKIFFCT